MTSSSNNYRMEPSNIVQLVVTFSFLLFLSLFEIYTQEKLHFFQTLLSKFSLKWVIDIVVRFHAITGMLHYHQLNDHVVDNHRQCYFIHEQFVQSSALDITDIDIDVTDFIFCRIIVLFCFIFSIDKILNVLIVHHFVT